MKHSYQLACIFKKLYPNRLTIAHLLIIATISLIDQLLGYGQHHIDNNQSIRNYCGLIGSLLP